jgi:hypothetical protein
MWAIIEFVVLAAIVLISITEFFYPLLVGKPLFNSFRKKGEQKTPDLQEKLSSAKEKIAEVKNIQAEVDKTFKSAEQLKEESDNLLK